MSTPRERIEAAVMRLASAASLRGAEERNAAHSALMAEVDALLGAVEAARTMAQERRWMDIESLTDALARLDAIRATPLPEMPE